MPDLCPDALVHAELRREGLDAGNIAPPNGRPVIAERDLQGKGLLAGSEAWFPVEHAERQSTGPVVGGLDVPDGPRAVEVERRAKGLLVRALAFGHMREMQRANPELA